MKKHSFLTCFAALILVAANFSTAANAAIITLDESATTTFQGDLRIGAADNNTGILFFSGRGASFTGNFVKQVGRSLNDSGNGYTTLSLENPVPAAGTAFQDYVNDETLIGQQVFARLDAAISEMANRGIENIVLSGLSLGSRFMTTATAAWEQGLFIPTANVNLAGLIGAGMLPQTGGLPRTPANPASIADFNIFDTESNLKLIGTTPVLDIYGNNDITSANFAAARRATYGGAPAQYFQKSIQCPPKGTSNPYYAFLGGNKYRLYYGTSGNEENRCHQLRDGYQIFGQNPDGSPIFKKTFTVRGSLNAPVESTIVSFLDTHVTPRTTSVYESESLLLLLAGLPLLLLRRPKNT